MKVLLANRVNKKVQPKISRVKNANIFKRKKHTKFARTDEDDLLKVIVVFGGLGM
jgi:hypothetical protein